MEPGKYLTFKLANSSFGLSIGSIREINRLGEVVPMPTSSPCVAGIINLRGKIISVIDLRKRFNMPESTATKESCIVVVDSGTSQVGMIVDSVQGVNSFNKDQIQESPMANTEASFVKAIGKTESELIMILDLTKCLSREEIQFNDVTQVA